MIADDYDRAFVQHVADGLAHRSARGLQGILVVVRDVALDERGTFLLLFHGFLLVVGVTGFGYSEMQVGTWCCFTVGARKLAMRTPQAARRGAVGAVRAAGCALSRLPGAAGEWGSGGSWLGTHFDTDGGRQRYRVEGSVGGGRLAAGAARIDSDQLGPDFVPVCWA